MELSDKSKIFLNTIIITASTILEKLLFFLINIIVARYLAIGQYGEYTTALAFASFFSMFTDLGINQTMIRELNYIGEKEYSIFNIIILKIFVSNIIFVIFLGSISVTGYRNDVIVLTIIFGFVRFGDEYLRLYYVYYEAKDKYSVSAAYRLLFAILFLIAIFLVIYIDGNNKEIGLSRFCIVFLFLLIITYMILKGKLKKFDINYIKEFILKAVPFASTFVSSNIIYQGNLIILPLLHGTLYTGIFQNAYIFLTTFLFIPSSFARVFIPYLYQHNRDENTEKFQFAFNILSKTYVFISFYIAILLFLYSDFIIVGIFGSKYSASVHILKIISLAIPFSFNAAYIILISLDKQIIYSRILKYVAALSIILNIILGFYFKESGTAVATVSIFIIIFIATNILIKNNSTLNIYNSIMFYLKGIFIFIICWWLDDIITVNSFINLIITSIIFLILNFILIFKKDDMRIIKEILGK